MDNELEDLRRQISQLREDVDILLEATANQRGWRGDKMEFLDFLKVENPEIHDVIIMEWELDGHSVSDDGTHCTYDPPQPDIYAVWLNETK